MRLPRIFDEACPLSSLSRERVESFAREAATAPKTLSMTVPDQIKDEWCWAATCAGVREAFEQVAHDPCQLAGEVLNLTCCSDPDICNRAMFLSVALERLGYFVSPIEEQLSFDEIAEQIAIDRPVCCFIDYGTTIGHFIVISAIDPSSESVGILDPAPSGPHSSPRFIPLESLQAGYGNGRWRETYRTQPRS
jgi:hypothetical protein